MYVSLLFCSLFCQGIWAWITLFYQRFLACAALYYCLVDSYRQSDASQHINHAGSIDYLEPPMLRCLRSFKCSGLQANIERKQNQGRVNLSENDLHSIATTSISFYIVQGEVSLWHNHSVNCTLISEIH
jgi:hypothetical protein